MKKQLPYSTPSGYFDSLPLGNFILTKSTASQPASDEEIIEYLIDSGMTLAQLENAVIIND